MVAPVLAVAASSWGVLMGVAPILQIRRMLREHSSRDVSLSYFMILLTGFLLWISYGIAAGNMALVIPNSVALLVGIALVTVAFRLRHQPADKSVCGPVTTTDDREHNVPGRTTLPMSGRCASVYQCTGLYIAYVGNDRQFVIVVPIGGTPNA